MHSCEAHPSATPEYQRERQRLIAWRLEWLEEEIAVAWAEQNQHLEGLMEEHSFWEGQIEAASGLTVPPLDGQGKPFAPFEQVFSTDEP